MKFEYDAFYNVTKNDLHLFPLNEHMLKHIKKLKHKLFIIYVPLSLPNYQYDIYETEEELKEFQKQDDVRKWTMFEDMEKRLANLLEIL